MAERSVQVTNKNGVHARPAAEIVKAAAKFRSEIVIIRDEMEVNGKSIMGVMMLAAECGATLLIRASGLEGVRHPEPWRDLLSGEDALGPGRRIESLLSWTFFN